MNLKQAKTICESCDACRLCETRNSVVFGEGGSKSGLMFVGEGPGENEDKTGRPFVGKAGEVLDRMLSYVGLSRKDVYITNVVKCRPPKNRAPLDDEIAACFKYLNYQIKKVSPTLIVALGASAAKCFGIVGDMKAIHGRVFRSSLVNKNCFVSYHPASVLYSPGLQHSLECDFSILMDYLHQEVSVSECINDLYTTAARRLDIVEKIDTMPSGFCFGDKGVDMLIDCIIAYITYKHKITCKEMSAAVNTEYVRNGSSLLRAVSTRLMHDIILEDASSRDDKFAHYLRERGIGDKNVMIKMFKELGLK